eukprot:GHVU01207878.1.p1 GENE.GHVU01207878.1~~GHVU01207878.1.p1  ORF type:complete len:1355 (+),score=235.70 GHVU01207878.1:302-4366(+)
MDDVAEDWERRARTHGFDPALVKFVLLRTASDRVLEVIERKALGAGSLQHMLDALARDLFLYDQQLPGLEAWFCSGKRFGGEMTELIECFSRKAKRLEKATRRWDSVNFLTEFRKSDFFMKKLPLQVERQLRMGNFDGLCYISLSRHALRISRALSSGSETSINAVGVDRKGPGDDQQAGMPISIGNVGVPAGRASGGVRAPPECWRCGESGHVRKDCQARDLHCTNCDRRGHVAKVCKTVVLKNERPLHEQTTFIKPTAKGLMIETTDYKNKAEVWRALSSFFDHQADKSSKPREGAAEPAAAEAAPPTTGAAPAGEASGRMQNRLALKDATRWYLPVEVAGQTELFLVDSGADASQVKQESWMNIAAPDRELAFIQEIGPSDDITGPNGDPLGYAQMATLPVKLGSFTTTEPFLVGGPRSENLLGKPWLEEANASLNLKSGTIWFEDTKETFQMLTAEETQERTEVLAVQVDAQTSTDRGGMIYEGLSNEERKQVEEVLDAYPEVWDDSRLGTCKSTEFKVELNDPTPVQHRVRPCSKDKQLAMKKILDDLIAQDAIEEADSGEYATAVIMVPKPGENKWRLVCDFRDLNDKTKKDPYPLPLTDALLEAAAHCTHYSTLDLRKGFHQIRVREEDREKLGFVTPWGKFVWKVMPFGPTNGPSTLQRLMNKIFKEFRLQGIDCFIDDIIIYAKTFHEHNELLHVALRELRDEGLTLNRDKVRIAFPRVKYLGFILDKDGWKPDSKKVEAISRLQPPKDVSGVRRFLGSVGYFRKFIKAFSARARLLTRLTKNTVDWQWGEAEQAAWEDLKDVLLREPVVLAFPNPDWEWLLAADASGEALGVTLMQRDLEKKLHVICYASKTFTDSECKWTIHEKEAFSIYWGVQSFRDYLAPPTRFEIRTDRSSLQWVWKLESRRIGGWAAELMEYNFVIKHWTGEQNALADMLSRDVGAQIESGDLLEEAKANPTRVGFVAINALRSGLDFRFPTLQEFRDLTEEELGATPELPVEKEGELFVGRANRKVYVPEKLRGRVLRFFHSGKVGAHQGVNRTVRRIGQHFWWPKMAEHVQAFIGACVPCVRRRLPPQQGRLGSLTSEAPGDTVALDFVGPIEYQGDQFQILTVVDHFTKYAEAVALPTNNGPLAWGAFHQRWISSFGCPNFVLIDYGSPFQSKYFTDKLEDEGIRVLHPLPYHPQGNGVCESFHQFLDAALAKFVSTSPGNLHDLLANVHFAYWSTQHPATGETPSFLMNQRELTLPHFQEWQRVLPRLEGKFKLEVVTRTRQEALERMLQAVRRRQEPCKKPAPKVEEGDLVVYFLREPEIRAVVQDGRSKLAPHWSEPCRVFRFVDTEKKVVDV